MKKLMKEFWNNEDGVTAIEYALIGVAMAGVLALVLGKSAGDDGKGASGLIGELQAAFNKIKTSISGYTASN